MWVEAIVTQMGNYGRKEIGDKFSVTKSYGDQLVKAGLVKEIETEDDSETVSESTIPKAPSSENDITDNTSPEEEAGTKPNPELVPEDVLIKVEKSDINTKEEKFTRKTK